MEEVSRRFSSCCGFYPTLASLGHGTSKVPALPFPVCDGLIPRSLLLHHLPKALCWELGLSMMSPSSEGSLLYRTFPRGNQLTEKRIMNRGICAINVFFLGQLWGFSFKFIVHLCWWSTASSLGGVWMAVGKCVHFCETRVCVFTQACASVL